VATIENLFLWIGSHFNQDLYLLTSKIQGICWSIADIALVLAVLRIAELARRRHGLNRLTVLHLLLWGSALLTPLLIVARKPREFFLLECVICGCQFLILLYVAFTERNRVLDLFLRHRPPGMRPYTPEPVRNPKTP
jgi:hypothetical protein